MVAKYITCLIQPSTVKEPAETKVSITAADARRHNIHCLKFHDLYIIYQEFLAPSTIEHCHKLIMEAYYHNGGIEMAKIILQMENSPPNVPLPANDLTWCICMRCSRMDATIEKNAVDREPV